MPIYCCLIRGVVDTGQPVMGAVGPVVPKEAAVSEFIFGDDKTVGGDAAVANGAGGLFAWFCMGMDDEKVFCLGKFYGLIVFFHGRNVHGSGQIEMEAVGRGFELYRDNGFTNDPVTRVAYLQGKVIMLYVDPGVIGLTEDAGAN